MIARTQAPIETIGQWLERLAATNTSDESDTRKMQNLLRRCGFPAAVVTCGIVYLEGQGTIEAPPTSLNSIAGMLVKTAGR